MHTIRDKQKITTRIKRIQGQLSALENSVQSEHDSYKVMMLLASCRGALNGLMGDIVNGHIKDHIVLANSKKDAAEAGDELIEILGSFLK